VLTIIIFVLTGIFDGTVDLVNKISLVYALDRTNIVKFEEDIEKMTSKVILQEQSLLCFLRGVIPCMCFYITDEGIILLEIHKIRNLHLQNNRICLREHIGYS